MTGNYDWQHATPEHVKQTLARRDFLRHAGGGLATVAAFSGLFTLPGCGSGGGGKSGAKGAIALQIVWPTKTTRFIPLAANSIVVTVKEAGSNVKLATATVTRPKTSLTMSEIPPGTATVTAVAYASSDGTGTPLASGTSGSVTVVASQTSPVRTITMATSVANVSVTSSASEVDAKKTCTLTASATDIDGATVLVAPSVWKWTSGNEKIATVSGSGTDNTATATGVADGSVTITATDAEDSVNVKAGMTRLKIKGAAKTYRVGWYKDSVATLHTADIDGSNASSCSLLGTVAEFSGDGQHYIYRDNGGHLAMVGSDKGTSMPYFYKAWLNCDATHVVWASSSTQSALHTATVTWSDGVPTLGTTVDLTKSGVTADTNYVAISADGSTVVYSLYTTGSDNGDIHVAKTDGSSLVNISETYGIHGGTPFINNDGSLIGYWRGYADDGYWRLNCVPATGGIVNSWLINTKLDVSYCSAGFLSGVDTIWWSEYTVYTYQSAAINQYLCNIDGSNARKVAGDALHAIYTPNGDYMAYRHYSDARDTGIRVEKLASDAITTLTTETGYWPVWRAF